MLFVTVLIALIASFCGAQPILTGYSHSFNLTLGLIDTDLQDVPAYYVVYYTVDGNNIHMGIVCDTLLPTGWVGFGISPTGMMKDSDAVIIWISDQGVFAEDFILQSNLPPEQTANCSGGVCADRLVTGCNNNLTNLSGRREGSYVVAEFTRPLTASESCDVSIPVDTDVNIVYAIGTVAPSPSAWPYNPRQHTLFTRREGSNLITTMNFNSTSSSSSSTTDAPSTTAGAATTGSAASTTAQTTGAAVATTSALATTGSPITDSSARLVFSVTGLLLAFMLSFGF